MDITGEVIPEEENRKHKNSDPLPVSEKKFKKFCAKELRKKLKTSEKSNVLQDFLKNIKDNKTQDVALEYLECSGSIQELLQCLEEDSTLSAVLVLEIINYLLLKVIKCGLECTDAAFQSCRYFLQNFTLVIEKMLGLSSSALERSMTLKFFTTMASYSSHLSKDILTYINFNLTRIELLSKSRIENRTVRKHFVNFMTALMIDIEYPILSLLLSKKGLLTSIIPGLIYDDVDSVCSILTAMKSNILENPLVSKTDKMKTFNTIVVKNIVNLYNWKGPNNLKTLKGHEIMVDEVQKAQVSQCVHDFLLTLCTSHKYGVIFRDPLVGMGKKSQNSLIYTVVDSMDSAWNHSYASELLIKICSACPDITKHIWNNIKVALEPRFSSKWLKVMDFVKRLLEELKPSCLEPYMPKLNSQQIGPVITVLVSPLPILKVIFPENCIYDSQIVRHQILSLVSSILKSIDNYFAACERWLDWEQFTKVKSYLRNYIERNFPIGGIILDNWNIETKKEEDKEFNSLEYLSLVFDIFEYYIKLSPDLLSSLCFSHEELKALLEITMSLCNADNGDNEKLNIQIIDIFLTINPSLFSLESDSFNFFLSFLLGLSYRNVGVHDFKGISVLRKLLKSTKIFDYASDRELDIWINGIFSLKSYKAVVSEFITASLKLADHKTTEYLKLILQYQESINDDNFPVSNLSPMVLGVLEYLGSVDPEKSQLSYVNFVIPNLIFLQYDSRVLSQILKNNHSLKNPLLEYVNSILSQEEVSFDIPKFLKIFGKNDIFNSFNLSLLEDTLEQFLNENEKLLYSNLDLDLLQMGIFYFSRLLVSDNSKKVNYSKNLILYIDYLLDKSQLNPSIIFNNFSFIQNFSILEGELNCCTKFIIDFIRCFTKKYDYPNIHMQFFNDKLRKMISKIIKNPKKYADFNVLQVINSFKMNSVDYLSILNNISDCISKNIEKCKFKIFYSILLHTIEKYCQTNREQLQVLPKDILENLLTFYTCLNQEGDIKSFELSKQFLVYFSIFPEHVSYIDANVVNSILGLKEYQKPNTDLIVYILKNRSDLIPCLDEKLDDLLFVKGLFYPILELLNEKYLVADTDGKKWFQKFFLKIYDKYEEVLHKTLRKPQKASQHLDENYKGVCLLIDLHFKKEKFHEYISKVLKFEVTKIFHFRLLKTIFKKYIETEIDAAAVTNTILTFAHLLLNILKKISKNEEHTEETLNIISDCFIAYLDELTKYQGKYDFKTLQNNESFKVMLKFSLKYGVSDYEILLQLLQSFISLIGRHFDDVQIELLMDMLTSHSGFLDVLLSENHKCKKGVLSLMTIMCENWPKLMSRSHIPKLLSSYRATVTDIDRMILKLIKMYESVRDEVSFQDFRPYLWGNAGAMHYSVRIDIGKTLLKQPKVKDVLNLLQENMVLSTIKNYHLYRNGNSLESLNANTIYDLEFLLPLFVHILSPENVVQTYQFVRSGALSLTLLGFSCSENFMKAASCDVLSRFYFHLEGRQNGKENSLYMKLITGICEWLAESKSPMNNFASIFYARTAMILSKPTHIMLPHLSQYLFVKQTLDFSTIPELYTYLHSSHVNYKEHQQFIFEILKDGLICENDYRVFFKSMSLKLLTELFSSSYRDTRPFILDILIAVCRLEYGVKWICTHSSAIQFLVLDDLIIEDNSISKESNHVIIVKMKELLNRIFLHMDTLNECDKSSLKKICEKLELGIIK